MKTLKSKSLALLLGVLILATGWWLGSGTLHRGLAAEEKPARVTEITWWTFPIMAKENPGEPSGTYEKKLIAAFQQENPDIRVNLELLDYATGPEKIDNAFTIGNPCDVLLDAPGRIIAYGNAGKLAPLNEFFDEQFTWDVKNLELLGACKSGETAYMYPLSSAPFYMAFNRDYLSRAGVLDRVKPGWTTKDFEVVLNALHSSGYVPGYLFCKDTGGDQGTRALVANLFDGAVTTINLSGYLLGDERGVQGMKLLQRLVQNGALLDGRYVNGTEAIESFVYGRASFTILWGPNQYRSYKDMLNTFGVQVVEVPLPAADGAPGLEYLVNGFCVMDNKDQEKISAGKKFIRFACDDKVWGAKNVVQTGCLPVRHSRGDLYPGDSRMKAIENWSVDYIPYYNTVKGFGTMRRLWNRTLKDVLSGYASVEEAMESFMRKANNTL